MYKVEHISEVTGLHESKILKSYRQIANNIGCGNKTVKANV